MVSGLGRGCGLVFRPLEEATQDPRATTLVLSPCTRRWPLPAVPTRRQGQPLRKGSDRTGWVYLLLADAGFSVPKVKSCWLTVFPAWVFPALPVFHPPHPGPPPPWPQAPPPGPLPGHRKTDSGALRFFLSRKLAPTGSGLSPGHPLGRVRTAADYTPVSLMGHSRATLLPGPARQLHLQRDALRHSVPLPL